MQIIKRQKKQKNIVCLYRTHVCFKRTKERAEIFCILFGIGVNAYYLRERQRRSGLAVATVQQETSKLMIKGAEGELKQLGK